MFDFAATELQSIDELLESKLAWAQDRQALCEQMALDASRLLSCVEDRLGDYSGQGFFRRCWSGLSGKNGEVERANARDLIEMQKHAWRYINLLQERDLLMAHSVITVKNNLLTLAVQQDETRDEITRLAGRIYDRFVALESRVEHIQVASNIHSWLLTLETRDYDEKYTPHLRLLRVVGDFHALKGESWNADELKYLQKALREVGLNPKQTLTIYDFVDALIDEIEEHGFNIFNSLTDIDRDHPFDSGFIVDAISAPAFGALYQVKNNYAVSSRVIRPLQRRLNFSHADAMKAIIQDFVTEHGIDTSSSIPLQHLAVELLGCLSLARRLMRAQETEIQSVEDKILGASNEEIGGDIAWLLSHSSEKSEAPKEIKKEQEAKNKLCERIIIECLLEYQDGDFYIGEKIPEQKHKMARKEFPVDPRAKMLGLIDTTLFGGCDEGMAICNIGIYWNNSGSKTVKKFVSWGELIGGRQFIDARDDKVYLAQGAYFQPLGSRLNAKYIARMIIDLIGRLEKL